MSDFDGNIGMRTRAIATIACLAAVVGLPLGAALIVSRLYWGYFFHRPSLEYELLFREAGGHLELLSSERWFVDIAGIEGLEWPFLFAFFLPLSCGFFGLVLLIAVWIDRRRTRAAQATTATPT